jgi:hypothetical protein
MRERFETQKIIGRKLIIEDTLTSKNSRDSMIDIVVVLLELYKNVNYRNQILSILDEKVNAGKSSTGRPGMDLWKIFVSTQIMLVKHFNYSELHMLTNYNKRIHQVMGIELEDSFGFEEVPYQTIYDNVSLLDDDTL